MAGYGHCLSFIALKAICTCTLLTARLDQLARLHSTSPWYLVPPPGEGILKLQWEHPV